MLKGMVGTKELQVSVSEIKKELPAMRVAIVQDVRADMKEEFNNAVQAYEIRMKNELRNFFGEVITLIKEVNKPVELVEAIEKREEDKERQKLREEIISSLSVIYAKEKETELFTKTVRGTVKLSKDGDQLYRTLSETVLKIAKYLGYKTHSKVASKTIYKDFQRKYDITEELTKKVITMSDGSNRNSVYVDLILRGLAGKFATYLESKFM